MSISSDTARLGVPLDKLFPSATRTGDGQVSAVSCASDWRQIQPGDVYVALPEGCGSEHGEDGHQHAQRAVSCGAIAVVCEQPVPVFDVPTYLVSDSREALGELCQALVEYPTRSLPTIGVTGTQGKSTTIALLDAIFAAADKHCGMMSSLGCYDGMSHSGGISDAPSAPSLASRLANMAAAPCTHALLEVSSQSLSQRCVAGIELDAVCVTNITEAHLDLHNSIHNYRETKLRVLNLLSPTGVVILNADDPVCMKWLDQVPGAALTYGLGGEAEIRGKIIERYSNEQIFVLTAGSDSIAVRTTIVGEHHVSNCLAAAALALTYGIDLQTIAKGLQSVESIPGRMERVDCGQGFPLYVDAAETPDALRAALRTARQITQDRVICVLGDKAPASATEDYSICQIVRRMADLVIATRPLPGSTDHNSATVELAPERSAAIAWAVSVAEPGDVVIIAGSQTSPRCGFGAEDDDLSDVEIARELLYTRNRATLRVAA
jgi:UDP-N-acetylmuramoyl-L-alanyl-D-glutamate--2,6-diaminopimelate ligase